MAAEIAPAIIAAVAALLGVVVSQLAGVVQTAAGRKREQQALLRAKLEELADMANRTVEWADLAVFPRLEGHIHELSGVSAPQATHLSGEARRAYVLALLYFPGLTDEAKRLRDAVNAMYGSVTSGAVDMKKLGEASTAFNAARQALDKLITEEAKRLI